jgi:hypothetical protein
MRDDGLRRNMRPVYGWLRDFPFFARENDFLGQKEPKTGHFLPVLITD